MTENNRVFDAFRNCITEPKCKDCPWEECNALNNRRIDIPIDLALAVMRMLKAQEPAKPTLDIRHGKSMWRCGSCSTALQPNQMHAKFCFNCGRAVKWE